MRRNLNPAEMRRLESLAEPFVEAAPHILHDINELCAAERCHLSLEYARRTDEEQLAIFAKGRELKSVRLDPLDHASWRIVDPGAVVTEALPGESPHNSGLAIDVALKDDLTGLWLPGGRNPDPRWARIVGNVASAFGKEWGGHFSRFDGAHIQEPNWIHHAVTRS